MMVSRRFSGKGDTYLEGGSFLDDILLRSRRHAIFGDCGGLGVRHYERLDDWGCLGRMDAGMNDDEPVSLVKIS
jgi:hypothetical protein